MLFIWMVLCLAFAGSALETNPASFFTSSLRHAPSADQLTAFRFFDSFQSPPECRYSSSSLPSTKPSSDHPDPLSSAASPRYAVVTMGCGGGFAAHFQLAASQWWRTAAYFNYTVPVIIKGHINGYSDGAECAHVDKDWTCFFLPMSTCQDHLLSHGNAVVPQFIDIDDKIIPPVFTSAVAAADGSRRGRKDLAWWWGAVQAYMFRLQPVVEKYIEREAREMDNGKGFPFGYPIAGVHVRHGDKSSDGFRMHSLDAEMSAIRKSPDCILFSSNTSTALSTSPAVHSNGRFNEPLSCYSNTSTLEPLRIFVASDDGAVLAAAKALGHLVDTSGVSQQTAGHGMFKTLLSHPDMGYNASLEIITDIFFLSQCSTLVGIAASQVYRMAIAISTVAGRLRHAVSMDFAQLPKIRKMSAKYDLPLPEEFQLP